jgi:1-acyl-sn-glycerol-3-phosphate acyltransferase
MASSEKSKQEYEFYKKVGDHYSNIFLYFNTIEYYGLENIIQDESGILAPNHVGSAKDIFTLYKTFNEIDTQLFFGARNELFDKGEIFEMAKSHLKRHTGILSSFIPDWRLEEFAEFCSSSLERVGTIPLNINHKDRSRRIDLLKAMEQMEQYVSEMGRKVVLFQFDRKASRDKSAVFHGAKKGAPTVAYNAYTHKGIAVPVYPIAIYGSHGLMPWHILTELSKKPIKVNIGEPLDITSFMDSPNPVESMRCALGDNIKGLLHDVVTRKDEGKIIYPLQDFKLMDLITSLLTKGEKSSFIYPGQQ